MSVEERIVNMMSDADLELVKHWVDNDISMLQNLNSTDKFALEILKPLLKELNVSADKVMFFLKKNREDIYYVVNKEWIQKQIDEFFG